MSLMSAMNNAVSGLRVTQAGIEVVSSNIANAGSIGYTRRTQSTVEQVAGGQSSGVRATGVQRLLDALVQRQLRLETAGAAYTDTRAQYYRAIDQLFGTPGGANALDTQVNNFTRSLQQLQTDPSSTAARTETLRAATQLASHINGLSRDIQGLRTDAEKSISSGIARTNELLGELTRVNSQVVSYSGDTPSPSLLDQRDRIIGELSILMDVKVTETANGSVNVFTTGGLQLFNGVSAIRLEFDERPGLGPQSLFDADPALRGVGTIRAVDGSGSGIDVIASGMIRSGELAAQIEMRDKTLVQAQVQLDELAAGLARALSDQQIEGVPATVGAATGFDVDIAGMQAGNTIVLDGVLSASGTPQRVTFVRVDDPSVLPLPTSGNPNDRVVGIDFTGGPASVATQIQTALGGGYQVSNPAGTTLRILDDGAGNTTNVVGLRASATQTALTGGTPEFPFFVDTRGAITPYTGSYESGSQLTGFSQRIQVNPALLNDSSRLVVFDAGPPATSQGDPTRPQRLLDALTQVPLSFSAASGAGGFNSPYSGSVAAFARRITELQGANAESAQRLDEGQKIVLSTVEARYSETSGVNIDQEMSILVQLQTAYSANARVVTAAKEMMDVLLRI